MRVLALSLASALALTACATAPIDGPAPHGDQAANDCAVIAAVAKEHYRFNTTDNVPPPLWLDAEGSTWAPRCDWSRHGLSFPRVHDPDAQRQPGGRVQWVSFKRPRYEGSGAMIEASIMHGPLAGMGVDCRVRSGVAGWTVERCDNTWIS